MDYAADTAQKMRFSIKNFFCKCDQIRSKLRIWSHLLKKYLMENFIFCALRPNSDRSQNAIISYKADRMRRVTLNEDSTSYGLKVVFKIKLLTHKKW